MDNVAFLKSVNERMERLVTRVTAATEGLTEDQLNQMHPKQWSIAQILEHVRISNSGYLEAISKILPSATRAAGPVEVSHTWIGKQIIKAAGPSRPNTPVPKKLVPNPGPFTRTVVNQFVGDHHKIAELAKTAAGVDVTNVKIRNPIVPLVKLSLADCFEILAVHGDRHVGQIEERVKLLN